MQGQGGAPLTGADEGRDATEPAAHRPSTTPQHPGRSRVVLLACLAVLVVAADAISKVVVVAELAHRAPITLIPHVLDLELLRNGGAAFSVGTKATVLFTGVALVVAAVIVRTAPRLVSAGWAAVLGLLLGGALGNLIDRLARDPGPGRGEVIDWIHLHHWPVFNLADSAIVIGAVVAVVLSALGVHATEGPGGTTAADGQDPSTRSGAGA
jgi:signal peptidase II